jgi:hypothetical protein
MRPKMKKLKHWLITNGTEIRETRKALKEAQRNNKATWKFQGSLISMTYSYRHHHIAYSEMKGRTREQIECPREGNNPNEDYIKEIKEKYWDEPKTVCASA